MRQTKMSKHQGGKHTVKIAAIAAAMLAAGCGGGGGSSSSASTQASSNLSQAQQNYEQFALASNGGQHYVDGSLVLSTSSTGALTVNSGSAFFTQDSALPQSPAVAGPQMLTTGTSSLSSNLAVPTINPDRYVINGNIVLGAVPAKIQVSYNGANVQETDLAADGQTTVQTLLGTSYTVVPLSGAISASPSELFTGSSLGILTTTINGNTLYNTQATWQSGSAYMKVTRQVVGDTLLAGDCALPATTGTNLTPCSTTATTLENFFPHLSLADNVTYNLSDGQIVTLAGVRAWVANTATAPLGTQYRVYFQANNQIYSGALLRNGTTLSILPNGSTTPQTFYIFLNAAARQSIAAAISF
jgi:hypothetical protein